MYDLTEGNGFRCLHQMDVDKLLKKINAHRSDASRKQPTEIKGILSAGHLEMLYQMRKVS